jgi:glycosyltransferase involved in cell wall biosynthesis
VEDTEVLSSVRRRYRLPGRFLLGLSTLQPRKNFEGLVDAFELIAANRGLQPGMADLDLVVAGEEGWLFEGIAERVQAKGLADRVHFLGRVPDDDLPAVYSLAEVFAFPTWYEGFGIPVVEAMACGTPVVASDNSSLPEAVGNAGIMVGAGDTAGLADGIVRILSDDALKGRLVSEGFKHARQFSWRRSAEQLLSVIEAFA